MMELNVLRGIIANAKKKKISFKKCISVKKKFVVIQIHLLQKMNVYTCSESKYKDKFIYTPHYLIPAHVNKYLQ